MNLILFFFHFKNIYIDYRERKREGKSCYEGLMIFILQSFSNIAGKLRTPLKWVLGSFSVKEFYDLLETEGFETPTHKR